MKQNKKKLINWKNKSENKNNCKMITKDQQ